MRAQIFIMRLIIGVQIPNPGTDYSGKNEAVEKFVSSFKAGDVVLDL